MCTFPGCHNPKPSDSPSALLRLYCSNAHRQAASYARHYKRCASPYCNALILNRSHNCRRHSPKLRLPAASLNPVGARILWCCRQTGQSLNDVGRATGLNRDTVYRLVRNPQAGLIRPTAERLAMWDKAMSADDYLTLAARSNRGTFRQRQIDAVEGSPEP